MIIKFRDSTIKRFNQKEKFTNEEALNEITQLQTEITLLK